LRLQLIRPICALALLLSLLSPAAIASGCAIPRGEAVPEADRPLFEAEVHPILARDCAFTACHGSSDRFFRVYALGRLRKSDALELYDPLTPDELEESYSRARSLLVGVPRDNPDACLLLAKPLSPAAGGTAHLGVDAWGKDVFASVDDPRYRTLRRWVTLAMEAQ